MSSEAPARPFGRFLAGALLGGVLGGAAGLGAFWLSLTVPAERAQAFAMWRAQTFRYDCPYDAIGPYEHPVSGAAAACVPQARVDIPAGTTLSEANVEMVIMAGFFVPNDVREIRLGRVTRERILKGDLLRPDRLEATP